MAQGVPKADRRRALILLLGVASGVFAIDQVTKHLAVVQLEHEPPVRLLGGAVYLTLVRNSGAAFSMFTNYTWVFPMIALGVVVGIAVIARRLASLPWAVALGLVLGGALGNLGDRLFRAPGPFLGHVVDMISVFDDGGQVFPVFNGADSALSIGVCLLVLLELTGRRRDGTRITKDTKDSTDPDQGAADEAAADVRG